MTANEIRQSFFDFFQSKQHTVVPSASLLPQSPGLLFTNAGMNQFVPYFLGTEKAPYSPPRATDTQKCIRAGGKHNDLDDVGYDTYHHTFFEMLGNWSFGDYFKPEAIQWSWELIVEKWGFPAERLYATVYMPDKQNGDPSEFDQEAYDLWEKLFTAKGLDPKKHIVNGDVKDNFWMMGETGPCGPCSELHVDLTPNGDTQGKLVNKDSDLCIEIWNLVFIQYNAEADGTFRDLPAKHIDTGMGFERAASIYQGTNGFKDFSKKPTNYATDIFTPLFKTLEKLSGKTYQDIYPETVDTDKSTLSPDLKQAVAFRVIADHIRTLSFSIADGILPGNTGRNYVLRRILRRAVRYARTLGFTGDTILLPQLVDTLVDQMAHIFPEMETRRTAIKETLQREEESFNRTLDRGLDLFEKFISEAADSNLKTENSPLKTLPGDFAFELYDTFGFPIDLTELLCQERKLQLDMPGFETRMQEARELSQASQKKTIVRALDISSDIETEFTGYDEDSSQATILEIHQDGDNLLVITDRTPFYVEMGGQLGDTGILTLIESGETLEITGTQKVGQAIAHIISKSQITNHKSQIQSGAQIALTINPDRRRPIESHHTATHLLHWALHEVVSQDATQQGSLVGTDRLRFDFSSGALTPDQVQALENKVNEKIQAASPVHYVETPHTEVKNRTDIMQFFGDKYGDTVRVVQIGGHELALDGYAMELCGGTHVTNTSEIGTFKIKSEGAIAAGVRRIEAVVGDAAQTYITETLTQLQEEIQLADAKLTEANQALHQADAPTLPAPAQPTEETIEALTTYLENLKQTAANADKSLKKAQSAAAASTADNLLNELLNSEAKKSENSKLKTENLVISTTGPANLLQELLNGLKKRQFQQAAFLIIDDGNRLHLGAYAGPEAQAAGTKAGNLIKELAPLAGGKGGGKPDQARGAAPERLKAQDLKTAAQQALA